MRVLRDYIEQLRVNDGEPVFDPKKFSDLDIDPKAWEEAADAPAVLGEEPDAAKV